MQSSARKFDRPFAILFWRFKHRLTRHFFTWRNRQQLNELIKLDERLLLDIGLTPDELNYTLRNRSLTHDPSHELARLSRQRAEKSLRRTKTK